MENTGIATYIERIEIEGLWGRFDVDWKLNPDVNVLIGKNGTGKTTILRGIDKLALLIKLPLVPGTPIAPPGLPFEKIIVHFNDNNAAKALFSSEITDHYRNYDKKYLPDYLTYSVSGHFPIPTIVVNTFEAPLLTRDDYETDKKPEIETTLDKLLEDLVNAYLEYQLNQSQKALRKEQTIDQAFAKRSYFIETLNRLFADSGKIVDEKQNRISFLIGDKPISAYQLSSGEKQLLILLLTVLTQDEKPSVLLLDEPESSLHLDWQYELINILRTLNPNCQLIIVTHSPSIFTDGHKPKVFWIEDILHPTKQALEVAK